MLHLKREAANKAISYLKPAMKLGLGTGSTANEFIKLLAVEINKGLEIKASATSVQTEELCQDLGIKLYALDDLHKLDLVVDGTDEINMAKNAIKGGGGALLREKITAMSSAKVLIIADETKLVSHLGAYPLPIEISKFAYQTTKMMCKELLDKLGYNDITMKWRTDSSNKLFITDGGNYILDVALQAIDSIDDLNMGLLSIPGIVEHGLFLNMVDHAIIAMEKGGVKIL